MANLSQDQVKQIIQNAPPGVAPADIVDQLRAQGHTLEGYPGDTTPIAPPTTTAPQEPYNPVKEAAQPLIGALKGAASTLYTVPQSIARITDAVTHALEGGKLDESMANLAKVTTALIHKANTLPDTDPRKKNLMDLAESNVKQIESLRGDQTARDKQSSSLNETPASLKPTTTGQKIGDVAEKAAEFLVPGAAIAKGEKAVQATTEAAANAGKITPLVQKGLNVAGGAALEGAGAATVNEAQTGDTKGSLKTGALSAVLSVPFKIFGQLKEPVANALQSSAEKKSAQALGATTKADKQLSEKIVPELLSRRVTFATRGGLLQKAQSSVEDVGGQLEETYSRLPPDTKIDIAPVIKRLEDAKDRFITTGAGGQRVVVDAAGYKAADQLQQTIISLAQDPHKLITNSDVSVNSLREARQILDKSIAKTGKSFALGAKDSAVLAAQKSGANAIRNELAQEFPQIAKINKEYNFWKNVETVVGNTVQRTKSQATPVGETIAEGAGAVIGATKGGGLGNIVLGATGYKLLKSVVTSPAWRQTSAVARSTLADALIKGNKEQALYVLNRLAVGVAKNAGKLSPEAPPPQKTTQ